MKDRLLRRIIVLAVLALLLVPAFVGAQGKEIVLKWPAIWVGKDSKAPAIAQIVESFNKANAGKIRVEVEPQPDYNAYEQKARTSLAARQVPGDIFTFNLNATTKEFYDSPLLMDFSKHLTGEWKASFDAGAVAQSTINRKLKSLPYETAILPIWYNTDLLKKAGVTSIPGTLPELWAAMDKLKAAGVMPMSQMSGDTNAWTSMLWFSHLVVSQGGANVWDKPFTDKVFVESAKILKRMFVEYSTPDAVGAGAGVSGGHFLAGRTAIFSNGPWYTGRADLRATPFFTSIVVAAAPVVGANRNMMISILQSNVAAGETKESARREAILTFLRSLTSRENIALLQATSGAMFAIDSGYLPLDPLQKQFYDLAAKSRITSHHLQAAYGAEATLEFAQQLGALVLDKISPEEFCALVEKKIDR
jgi:raffinose/stachyose/melibiose transport system substrate-binding protein